MKVYSMFSGVGGFDLAMRNLGHEIVGACEIDKYARSVYAKQFPGVPISHDATEVQAESLPHFDVLCGGFPCQAFSTAGKREGFNDCRGTLFFEIARIAEEKRPSILFLENVKGLLNHNGGETFRTILEKLDEIGYDVEWQLINSKYFVPQNRERIYIIGHLRGECTRQVLPLGDINEESSAKGRSLNNSHIKHFKNSSSQANRVYNVDGIAPTLGKGNAMKSPMIKSVGQLTQHNGTRVYDTSGISPTLMSSDGSGTTIKIVDPLKTTEMVYISNTNANMVNRIQDRKVSWTLGTGTDFAVKEGTKIRRLMPIECERLQGFPDNWTEGLSDTQRYRCCGNAVTVPVVQYIASHFEFTTG